MSASHHRDEQTSVRQTSMTHARLHFTRRGILLNNSVNSNPVDSEAGPSFVTVVASQSCDAGEMTLIPDG